MMLSPERGNDVMSTEKKTSRYELKWSSDTHELANRAAAAGGYGSVKEYLSRLVHADAPKTIHEYETMKLTNEQFDKFIAACEKPPRPLSEKLKAAANRLDEEGLTFNVRRTGNK